MDAMSQVEKTLTNAVAGLVNSREWPKLRDDNGGFGLETFVTVDGAEYMVVFDFGKRV
jgi:hypothetical protein